MIMLEPQDKAKYPKAIESTLSTKNSKGKTKNIEGILNSIKQSNIERSQMINQAFFEIRELRAAETLDEQSSDIEYYFKWATDILKILLKDKISKNTEGTTALKNKNQDEEENIKIILRFFELTDSYADCVTLVYPEKKEDFLKKIQEKFGKFFLSYFQPNNILDYKLDWRLGRKLLNSAGKSIGLNSVTVDETMLVESFLQSIQTSEDYLIWQSSTKENIKSCRAHLEYLKILCHEQRKSIENAIITGRFDKKLLSLKQGSLILGEDGGLYLLLNRNSPDIEEIIKSNPRISSEYIKGKTDKDGKIKIGEGSFGTVKFAMSLFDSSKILPGEIICVKKSKSFEKIATLATQSEASLLTAITDCTVKDYFAGDVAEIIRAPTVYDLALLHHEKLEERQKKGYLMMEVLPQNTADKIFKNPQFQLWEYQKPYSLGVLKNISELLEMLIVFTDLKPENTLFDTNIRKPTMIDLGGTIKLKNKQGLHNFKASEETYEFTKEFCPPELNPQYSNDTPLNLEKSMSYICGKTLDVVLKKGTDMSEQEKSDIQSVIDDLTTNNPGDRIDIGLAIKRIEEIGTDDYKRKAIFLNYVEKLRDRINNNLSSLSLNEDILDTERLLIDIEVDKNDPELYVKKENQSFQKKKEITSRPLFDYLEKFLLRKIKPKVLIVFGSAGTGKSIALQLKFIQKVRNWNYGDPLPMYFNLANETDIKKIFNNMNQDLACNIDFGENMDVFIDSFDEGVDIKSRRESIFHEYLDVFGKESKFVVSCRSEYVIGEDFSKWFENPGGVISKYIMPVSLVKNTYDIEDLRDDFMPLESSEDERHSYENMIDTELLNDYRQNGEFIDDDDASNDNDSQQIVFADQGEQIVHGEKAEAEIELIEAASTGRNESDEEIPKDMDVLEIYNGPRIRTKKSRRGSIEEEKKVKSKWKKSSQTLDELAKAWLAYHKKGIPSSTYRSILRQRKVSKMIKSGFSFELIMQIIEELNDLKIKLTYFLVFKIYINNYIKKAVELLSEEQAAKSLNFLKIIGTKEKNESLTDLLIKLGKLIASELALSGRLRIDNQSSQIFKLLDYNSRKPFKEQTFNKVLSLLPLKIETKKSISKQDQVELIQVGFAHDKIKSYLMVDSIIESARKNESNPILYVSDICLDKEFVSLFHDAFEPDMREGFLNLIYKTRDDKSDGVGVQASNVMALLVIAGEQFSCADLSGVSIKGANLSNCCFNNTDFTNANLEAVDFRNCNLDYSNFTGAYLKDVQLDYMEIQLNPEKFQSIQGLITSQDSNRIIALYKNWFTLCNGLTGEILFTIDMDIPDEDKKPEKPKFQKKIISNRGFDYFHEEYDQSNHNWEGNPQLFAVDHNANTFICIGKKYLSLWNLITGRLICDYEKFTADTLSVAISGNGSLFSIGYKNNQAKVLDLKSFKIVQNISFEIEKDDVASFNFVALNNDGSLLAACSNYGISENIAFWNTFDGKIIRKVKCYHVSDYDNYSSITRFKMSSNGDYLAVLLKTNQKEVLKLWSSKIPNKFSTIYKNDIQDIALSGDGIILGAYTKNSLNFWNVSTRKLISSTMLKQMTDCFMVREVLSISNLCFNFSGEKMIGAFFNKIILKNISSLKIMKPSRGAMQLLKSRFGSDTQNAIIKAGFINQDKWFYIQMAEGYRIWDSNTGNFLKLIKLKDILRLADCISEISPCGKFIALENNFDDLGNGIIYDIEADRIVMDTSFESVLKFSFSEENSLLVTFHYIGIINLWDIIERKLIFSTSKYEGWGCENIFLSGNGNYILGILQKKKEFGRFIDGEDYSQILFILCCKTGNEIFKESLPIGKFLPSIGRTGKLAVLNSSPKLLVWEKESGSSSGITRLLDIENAGFAVISPEEDKLIVGSNLCSSSFYLYDVAKGYKVMRSFKVGNLDNYNTGQNQIILSSDWSKMLLFRKNWEVYLYKKGHNDFVFVEADFVTKEPEYRYYNYDAEQTIPLTDKIILFTNNLEFTLSVDEGKSIKLKEKISKKIHKVSLDKTEQYLALIDVNFALAIFEISTGKIIYTAKLLTDGDPEGAQFIFDYASKTISTVDKVGKLVVWEIPHDFTESPITENNDLKPFTLKDKFLLRSLSNILNNNTISLGCSDSVIRIWDLKTKIFTKLLKGHSNPIYYLRASSDGKTLASASETDSNLGVWNIQTSSLVAFVNHKNIVGKAVQLEVSPCGRYLAGLFVAELEINSKGEKSARSFTKGCLWDISNSQVVLTFSSTFHRTPMFLDKISFGNNGNQLVYFQFFKTIFELASLQTVKGKKDFSNKNNIKHPDSEVRFFNYDQQIIERLNFSSRNSLVDGASLYKETELILSQKGAFIGGNSIIEQMKGTSSLIQVKKKVQIESLKIFNSKILETLSQNYQPHHLNVNVQFSQEFAILQSGGIIDIEHDEQPPRRFISCCSIF